MEREGPNNQLLVVDKKEGIEANKTHTLGPSCHSSPLGIFHTYLLYFWHPKTNHHQVGYRTFLILCLNRKRVRFQVGDKSPTILGLLHMMPPDTFSFLCQDILQRKGIFYGFLYAKRGKGRGVYVASNISGCGASQRMRGSGVQTTWSPLQVADLDQIKF